MQVTNIGKDRENITADSTDVKWIIGLFYEQLHANQFNKLRK